MADRKGEAPLIREIREKVKRVFWYSVWFSLAINVLMLFLPFYSLLVFDKVLSSHSMETLAMLSVIVAVAFVVMCMFNALRTFVLARLSDWVDANLAPKLLELAVARGALSAQPQGNQALRDLGAIKSFVTGQGMQTLLDAPWVPVFIITTFAIHWILGCITLAGAVILFGLALFNELQTKKPLEEANHATIRSMRDAESFTRNADSIEAMGMMTYVVRRWSDQNMTAMNTQKIGTDRAAIIASISKFFRLFIQMLLICAGAYYAINHSLTVGALIAGPILAGRALAPFEAAIGVWKSLIVARDAYRRINDGLQETGELRGTMRLPSPNGLITVENVYFRPPRSEKMALANVSFRLEPGESMGLIGPSAAGKSTLAKLMVGIWSPSSGTVRMDGNDIFKWMREDAGQYIGFLPQGVELFPVSVKDNIARLNPDAPSEAIVEAAKMAGAHEMIIRLPKGYDTNVGEGFLSPGQQQRVALARALYGKPRLLILDEPNSNLDAEGEAALLQSLLRLRQQGVTTVIITHKPAIVSGVDKLLVLREGVVEMFGPREAVMQRYTEGNRKADETPFPGKAVENRSQGGAV